MKSKSMILMFVSLGFGLIAAVGISQVMGKNQGSRETTRKMTPVLVALDHIDLHSKLTSDNVKIDHWPSDIVPEDVTSDLKDIEDMAIKTRVAKGMPILRKDLVAVENISRLPIPKNFKAVAIKVSADDTINGLLRPGDRVDVIGVFKTREDGETFSVSKTFLKNIQVFSVDDSFHNDGPREAGNSKNNSIVGVLLNERQSEQLVLVQKVAQLKLVLRGNNIDDDEDTEMADIDEELNKYINGTPKNDEEEEDDFSGYQYASKPKGYTQRVWVGSEMIEYTHGKDGTITSNTGELSPFGGAGSTDSAGKTSSPDIERDLEEDQYPGE